MTCRTLLIAIDHTSLIAGERTDVGLDKIQQRRKSAVRFPVLAVAVGIYPPFGLSIPIFAGAGIAVPFVAGFRLGPVLALLGLMAIIIYLHRASLVYSPNRRI